MKLSPRMLAATLAATVFASGLVMASPSSAKNDKTNNEGSGYEHKSSKRMQDQLTPEKKAQFDTIMKGFMEQTQGMRDKMEAKRIEISALGKAPVVDAKAMGKATEEMVTLRNEMRQEWMKTREKIAKDVGITMDGSMNGSMDGPRKNFKKGNEDFGQNRRGNAPYEGCPCID